MKLNDIIERIGYFRSRTNISARKLSEAIGKSITYISILESSGFDVPMSVVLEIISYLNITPEEFFAKNYRDYHIDTALYGTLQQLNHADKTFLLELAKKLSR